MKISARLMLLVGLMSALLVLVGGVGLWGTASSNAALKTVYEDRTVALAQLGDVRGRLITNAFVLVSAALDASPAAATKSTAQVEANIASVSKTWDAYMAAKLTPDEEKAAKQFAAARATYVTDGLMAPSPARVTSQCHQVDDGGAQALRPARDAMEALVIQTTKPKSRAPRRALRRRSCRFAWRGLRWRWLVPDAPRRVGAGHCGLMPCRG
jgi:methyl-accepting chemotaxis protein-1 (serine sensor receptor)